ncbi:uncharacterized protein N7496_006376 [Penicillium cataractarum]|uniref:DUF7770 domain-containing protein n=1 Tax=Penicillium cataractarum TaxID=2100454 RepID=A0A9W9V7D1_9EURO|nr:uncharacterized protein N7496_006376 [Penicillium cataractarum]KAJ5370284.1 hypothetical protein N7496_006376 [Penicillium cataractarum]
MTSHRDDTKRQCTADDRDLAVQSITVTVHNQENNIDGVPIHRNHATIYPIVPRENSIRIDMVLNSADDTAGFLEAIYCYYTQSRGSLMNFGLSVRPGLLVHDVVDLIYANGRQRYRFTRSLTGCRFWVSTVIYDFEAAGFLSSWSYYNADDIKERLQYRYVVGQAPEGNEMEQGWFF